MNWPIFKTLYFKRQVIRNVLNTYKTIREIRWELLFILPYNKRVWEHEKVDKDDKIQRINQTEILQALDI